MSYQVLLIFYAEIQTVRIKKHHRASMSLQTTAIIEGLSMNHANIMVEPHGYFTYDSSDDYLIQKLL